MRGGCWWKRVVVVVVVVRKKKRISTGAWLAVRPWWIVDAVNGEREMQKRFEIGK